MFFYHIAPLGVRSPLLTYTARTPLLPGTLVGIEVRKKIYDGVVITQTQAPDFTCKDILDVRGYFGSVQRFLARFIAYYYRASLPESYKLFLAFTPAPAPIPKPYSTLQPQMRCDFVSCLYALGSLWHKSSKLYLRYLV